MKVWKRNAVVAVIVLFVCVAVYLNWSYGRSDAVSSDLDPNSTKTLGEAALVGADETANTSLTLETAENEEQSTAVSGDYFDAARISRQEARDEALAILQATVDDPNANEAAVTSASESISTMAETTVAENEIESLVAAKGYSDCVTYIGDHSVSIVVASPEGGLQASDVAKITDIVLGQTAFSADQVKVIEQGG